MVFVAEAFAGWLFGQLTDASRNRLGGWLLGSDQQRALQQAATAAIWATAQQLRPRPTATDDPQGPDHLARVIDHVFRQAPTPTESLAEHATLLQGLQAGVAARLSALDDRHLTGIGQSSAALLSISVAALTELLVGQLLREVVSRGASGGPLTPMAAQLNHDLTHLQAQQHNAHLARLAEDLQSALATLDRLDRQAGSMPAKTTSPLGHLIRELTDPFALEVHRAIDAPAKAATLPALPAYVQRDHDRQLQAIIQQAADGHSAAAVLVGGSSTGKTRACWEAVQALPDWRLWHPIDPSRPEAAADALPRVGPQTVIWLNEAQHYLLTPASDLGERVAAGLRELLRYPGHGPVLLLGTIWSEYWATLTTPPDPGQQDDPHAQGRALLTGTDIPVPDAFTGPALQALQAAARADPRLAEAAARAEDGRITQFLAGAPTLLERYRNAPAAAKALLEAAMDARRLGHGLYLPHGLLEAAAPGYLSDQQWDGLGQDWLEQALAYCAAPCRGARGPLTRVRPRPGQPVPAQPNYRLADYLEQTGRAMRRTVLPPAALWDALVDHAAERDLLRIAEGAQGRSLRRHAFQLFQRAAEAGHHDALVWAAELLGQAGRIDEAIGFYQRAAETGDRYALPQAAVLLEEAGRIDEAIGWFRRAAEGGDDDALDRAVELLEAAGRVDEAIDWLQTLATKTGDYNALRQAADLLNDAGRLDEAIGLYQRAGKAGDPVALRRVAVLLEGGDDDIYQAIVLYQRAAEAGDPLALKAAAEGLKQAGRVDEAIDWLQTLATKTGDYNALRQAADLLNDAGRLDEAIGLYQRAGKAGDRDALRLAAKVLARAGRMDEAIGLYERAAEAGDRDALRLAANLLEEAGRRNEAIGLYQRAAQTGDPLALERAFELLEAAGRVDAAIEWLQTLTTKTRRPSVLRLTADLLKQAGHVDEAIDWLQTLATQTGNPFALAHATELLGDAGRVDEAIDWLGSRASAGDPNALHFAADLLKQNGRHDEAIDWFQRAVEAGNPFAGDRVVELLEAAGRAAEAIDWLQTRATEAGDPMALGQAAQLLKQAGRVDEAIGLYQHAAETGDPRALDRAAELLERTGRIEEAAQLRRYGLDPGGHIADEWR